MIRTGLMLSVLATAALAGCGTVPTIGNTQTFGDIELKNPSPVVVNIKDMQKSGTASGAGPASYDSVNRDGTQSFSSGLNRTAAHVHKSPDGSITTSFITGKDSVIKDTTFNPNTGQIKIGEITTSASEPIRAHNEAYPPLIDYFKSRDAKSKDTILRVVDAIDKNLGDLLRVAAGIAVP